MPSIFTHDIPVVLSIAGSDCSGGAGIQADIRACAASGVYCATVITALTAQNPDGVISVNPAAPQVLRDQLDAVLGSIRPDAVKIGMIPDELSVHIIAEALEAHGLDNIVIDPVLRSTSGTGLNTGSTLSAMTECLLPMAALVTPNIPELDTLCRATGIATDINNDMKAVAVMERLNIQALLVKGGHAAGDMCEDHLHRLGHELSIFSSPRIESAHTHGTGCTLSSAIASGLAKGLTLEAAVGEAKTMITDAIDRASRLHLFPDNGPVLVSGVGFR